jgi:hypothetical protein
MVIFRWILGILTLLLGGSMALTFLFYIGNGNDEWLKLSRRLRHWCYLVLLFWLNFEVWRRVVLIIVYW